MFDAKTKEVTLILYSSVSYLYISNGTQFPSVNLLTSYIKTKILHFF